MGHKFQAERVGGSNPITSFNMFLGAYMADVVLCYRFNKEAKTPS